MKATYDGKSRTYSISLTDTDLEIFSGHIPSASVHPFILRTSVGAEGLEHKVELTLINGRYKGKHDENEGFGIGCSHDELYRVTNVRITLNAFDHVAFADTNYFGAANYTALETSTHVVIKKEVKGELL